MRLEVQEEKEEEKILFIYGRKYKIISELLNKLSSYKYSIFHSKTLPKNLSVYKYIFDCKTETDTEYLLNIKRYSQNTTILIFNAKKKLTRLYETADKKKLHSVKIINVDPEDSSTETIERIIWFSLAQTAEQILDLEKNIKSNTEQKIKKQKKSPVLQFFKKIRKRHFLAGIFGLVFFLETFFLLPLLASSFFVYQSYNAAIKNDAGNVSKNLALAVPFLQITDRTYQAARPLFSIFFLSLKTDNIVAIPALSWELIDIYSQTNKNGKEIMTLIFDKDTSVAKKSEIKSRLDNIKLQTDTIKNLLEELEQKMTLSWEKIRSLKQKIASAREDLSKLDPIIENIDEIIGAEGKRKYLVLFQNNMEIRPGGGFIGSFAILTFSNYFLEDIYVEDVYEADGQLKAHVEPPNPIKKYMDQPHWFLRDSNFSADFETNFNQAEFFLEKEIGVNDLNGGIGMTTSAVSYLIEGMGQVYVPDYDEIINSDNFYIKTQTHSEKDFFPGSKQKKNFLSSLVDAILININAAPPNKILQSIKQGLDEKQIVVYFKNKQIQKTVDALGYSGALIVPKCPEGKQNCIADTAFAVDANLGVNKANFFVTRVMNLKVNITAEGKIENIFTINFSNNAQSEAFPGGSYKNYFQLYLPKNIAVKQVLYDGKRVSSFDIVEKDSFTVVSHFFSLPPKNSSVLQIHYSLNEKIKTGKNLYQLIVQKQIGANNNDFVLQVYLPENVTILDNNFAALAKEGSMIYNTSLSTDRIFFIELNKN